MGYSWSDAIRPRRSLNERINDMADSKYSTKAGCDYKLDVAFKDGTKLANWYIMLIDSDGFTGASVDDTAASHTGWTELQSYSEAARPAWAPGAVSGQAVEDTTGAVFTFNAAVGVQGYAVISNNTKGGTSGTLMSVYIYDSIKNFNSGEKLTVKHKEVEADGN